ncbi:hypothetical protein [Streptomyces sp. NPDC056061]|uniref:hypothetical protein n=1 Tax=Streptomyces sp. NPDC056061 TaxID=3345700 RepID=UPI0035DA45DB
MYTYTSGDRSTEPNAHPGLGVVFHSKSRIFMLFQHTARPGQGKGSEPFALQEAF